MSWNNLILLVLGVWLIVSPWVLGYSDINIVAWNGVTAGSLVVVFTLWNYDNKK